MGLDTHGIELLVRDGVRGLAIVTTGGERLADPQRHACGIRLAGVVKNGDYLFHLDSNY